MTVETVLVGLPGTSCSPAVFEPMTRALAGEVNVVPFSWLTQPGLWDVPSVAERVAGHLAENWPQPVIVCSLVIGDRHRDEPLPVHMAVGAYVFP